MNQQEGYGIKPIKEFSPPVQLSTPNISSSQCVSPVSDHGMTG